MKELMVKRAGHPFKRLCFVLTYWVIVYGLTACQKMTSTQSASQTGSSEVTEQSDWLLKSDARRGLIAAPSGQIKDDQGKIIWDFDAFAFVKGDAPSTVNPSLWRQATLNNQIGLFKVTEGI